MSAVPAIGRAEHEAALLGAQNDAAERLYARHQRSVYAFCLAQLRNRDDAADALQTTFMYALGALRRGVTPTFEVPWLLAIARNVCRTRGAARTRRRHLELAVDPQDLAELAPAPERVELLADIEHALARLPEQQRRAVVLRDWQGLGYKEIADHLGVSLAAAETLIFRGRSALARELSGGETRKRRFSLGSLVGVFRTGALGGGGAAAKVAIGATVVVGASVAGTKELAHRPPASPPLVHRALPAPPSHVAAVAAAPVVARARVAVPVQTRVLPRRARPHVAAPATPKPSRAAYATRASPRPARPAAPAKPPREAPAAEPVPAPAAAPPTSAPAPAPATPEPSPPAPAAPKASPPAPAPAAPTSTPPGADPPAPPPPAATPEPAPAAPLADPVPDVITPVATTVTQAATPAAPVVAPVVTTVTAVTDPVVTTVTSTVTAAVTPVVTTVTTAVPAPLPLPHLP